MGQIVKRREPALLARLSEARAALDKARTLDDVKLIRDKAEALRVLARAVGSSLEIQNHAAEVKIRAERRGGEMLSEMDGFGSCVPIGVIEREVGMRRFLLGTRKVATPQLSLFSVSS